MRGLDALGKFLEGFDADKHGSRRMGAGAAAVMEKSKVTRAKRTGVFPRGWDDELKSPRFTT